MAEVVPLVPLVARSDLRGVGIVRSCPRASARRPASGASRSDPSRPPTTRSPRRRADPTSRRPSPCPRASSTARGGPRSRPAAGGGASTAPRRRRSRRVEPPARARRRCRRGSRRRSSRRDRARRRTPPARASPAAPSPSSNVTRSASPAAADPLDRDRVELRRDLDPAHVTAVLAGEQQRRPASPRGDVEDARARRRARAAGRAEGASPRDVGFWISCVASATTK